MLRLSGFILIAALSSACAASPSTVGSANDPGLAAGHAAIANFPPPGAALSIVADDRASHTLHGREQLPNGPAVSNQTIFQIASLTKPFTAIVILRLAEQKRLGLDDRAAKWLDWLPARYAAVTVRNLLNHTSGVPRDLRRENVDEFSMAEFRRRFLAAEPSFPAGTKWEYSNTGYTLLSLIAERASGRSFGALLQTQIFQPVGMKRTSYRAPLKQAPGRAVGYDWQDGSWTSVPPVYSGFGNSGIESTAADLGRFAQALHARQLLSVDSYRQMLAPAVLTSGKPVEFPFRASQKTSYGFGWFLMDMCDEPVAVHGGTIAGFSSNLTWAIRKPVSAFALSNGKSGPDRIGVADKIATSALHSALGCQMR